MPAPARTPPVPTRVVVHQQSRVLELAYEDGAGFRLPFEYLRVFSPSAEVRGHGPGQEVLQTGKREVGIVGIEPVGNYALQPSFDDGHSSGIYSWEYLRELGERHEANWADYLDRLAAAGASREPASRSPGDAGPAGARELSRPGR